MGIDTPSDIAADIQIGPTDLGMVRIYISAEGGIELPLDFDPDEAEEIAEELRVAAERAREIAGAKPAPGRSGRADPAGDHPGRRHLLHAGRKIWRGCRFGGGPRHRLHPAVGDHTSAHSRLSDLKPRDPAFPPAPFSPIFAPK